MYFLLGPFLFSENQERLYLVLIISVTSGVVLCLIIVIVRLIFTRRKTNDANSEQGKVGGQFKTSNTGETTITNGFSADDISEIDADIDLTTPLPLSTNPNITRNDVSGYYLHNEMSIKYINTIREPELGFALVISVGKKMFYKFLRLKNTYHYLFAL